MGTGLNEDFGGSMWNNYIKLNQLNYIMYNNYD